MNAEAQREQEPGRRARSEAWRWLAVLLPVLMLAAQHACLPLLFDSRFFTWRLLMFVPFAAMVGLALRWRPRWMPYMVVGHALMDLMTMLSFFMIPA